MSSFTPATSAKSPRLIPLTSFSPRIASPRLSSSTTRSWSESDPFLPPGSAATSPRCPSPILPTHAQYSDKYPNEKGDHKRKGSGSSALGASDPWSPPASPGLGITFPSSANAFSQSRWNAFSPVSARGRGRLTLFVSVIAAVCLVGGARVRFGDESSDLRGIVKVDAWREKGAKVWEGVEKWSEDAWEFAGAKVGFRGDDEDHEPETLFEDEDPDASSEDLSTEEVPLDDASTEEATTELEDSDIDLELDLGESNTDEPSVDSLAQDDGAEDQNSVTVAVEAATDDALAITEETSETESEGTTPSEPSAPVEQSGPAEAAMLPAPSEDAITISVLPKPRLPVVDDTRPIELTADDDEDEYGQYQSKQKTQAKKETKYIGYLPHSGFHNQRIELQNALMLGKMMGRTVLVPPVWVGWPTPTLFYDELQSAWNDMVTMHANAFNVEIDSPDAASYLFQKGNFTLSSDDYPLPEGSPHTVEFFSSPEGESKPKKAKPGFTGYELAADGYPITNMTAEDCKSYRPECRHTYKDTFLAWDSLVDLDKVADITKVVDRWDVRENALLDLLNITSDDVYVLRDEQRYDFQFTDYVNPDGALIAPHPNPARWARRVSIPTLAALPHKVILIGSLFHSFRVENSAPSAVKTTAALGQGLAFASEWLIKPADAVRDRLGSSDGYVGVHARVGDGTFRRHAKTNMEAVWRRLIERLDIDEQVAEDVWERVKPQTDVVAATRRSVGAQAHASSPLTRRVAKRHAQLVVDEPTWARLDNEFELDDVAVDETSSSVLRKRATPMPLLIAPRLTHLKCRGDLYTEPELRPLNVPLYLATDSRDPPNNEALQVFFETFPCTFILSDFQEANEYNDGVVVDSINDMLKLVNERDGIPLGRLFLPFLEAAIAAKSAAISGTQGSTFSGYAQTSLHDAYRIQWEEKHLSGILGTL